VALGDSIYSNMMVFGAAWQRGLVPLSLAAIRKAMDLNGAGVEANLRAFEIGRWAVLHPAQAAALLRARGARAGGPGGVPRRPSARLSG
jgi:indolepyruvate ferredoxin oxidoreductase